MCRKKQTRSRKEEDAMSAEARNYVYRVKVTDPNKKVPTITLDFAKQCQKEVEQYLKKTDGNKV